MSYQVIARKYRPQRFSDVVGQEHVTQTLANAITQKRIAHAYLFCGPRGTGKTTIARIFAKCLNCTGGPRVDFPDDDPRANEIAEGRALDVLEIDGASNNGVEQVRELRETCRFAPAAGQFKIYIIDEVHMLSAAAFNALLKTLEEPPAHVKFLFATTDPQKVLPTILSRCQRFDLRRIPAPLIAKHLKWIATQEKVTIDEAALFGIARGAEGGLRDAESTLDQLISFCGNTIQESDVLSMFGLLSRAQILSITGAVIEGDIVKALGELNDLEKAGKDLTRLVSELLGHFRNLLLYQVSKGNLSLLEVSEDEAATLKERSGRVDAPALTRIMEVLSDCESGLHEAVSKKILIEVALFRAIEARDAVPVDTVIEHLRALRDGGVPVTPVSPPRRGNASNATPAASAESHSPVTRVAASASEPVSAPTTKLAPVETVSAQAAEPVSPPTLAAELRDAPDAPNPGLETLWASLVEAIGRASPFTRSHLIEAFPVSFEKGQLLVGFDPEFKDQLGLVDTPRTRALFHTKLAELGHRDAQVKFVQREAPAERPRIGAGEVAAARDADAPSNHFAVGGRSTPPSAEDFANDPLIKQALELFKGQIVKIQT